MGIKSLGISIWMRRLAWLAVGLVTVWGLAWLVLPGIVKSQLEKMGRERLGRSVSVGSVSVRPWSLELTLEDLAVARADSSEAQLRIQRIYLDAELQSLLKLAPVVDAVAVEGVSATLTHLADGRYDVDDILARLTAAPADPQPTPLPRFALYNLRLQGLSLDFVDQPAKQTHTVRGLNFSLPFLSNLEALREVHTEPRLSFELNGAHFDSAAQTLPFAISHKTQAHFQLTALDLRPFLSYLPKNLPLRVQAGVLNADVQLTFEQAGKPEVKLSGLVTLKQGRAVDSHSQELLAFDTAQIELKELRPLDQFVRLGAVTWQGPSLHLRRNKAGEINLSAQGGATTPPQHAASAPARPWQIAVEKFALQSGRVRWTDEAAVSPVDLEARDLTLQASGLVWPKAQPLPFKVGFTLQAPGKIKAGREAPGRLDFSGMVGLTPLSVQGKLQAERLPMQALAPYLADVLNIELLRAQAGFSGELRYADGGKGPTFDLHGDTVLEALRANSLAPARTAAGELPLGQELLNWKALNLRGLALAMAPGQAISVDVKDAVLADFYARVIVNESGRINLQDVFKSSEAPPAGAAPGPRPLIRVGQVSLVNGRVLFSDRFIKPNYTARLTQLTGRLGAFSSAPGAVTQMADLELRGRAEGSASLEILGKLNPLAQPLALDIQGKMRNLELTPLSPYSVKYAGHGIERGQLSMDVAYRVQPDGQLTASNKLVLNQLTFGEPVEGAPNSLPVRLAVALLADRNGVIDIDLPISGSLNDPEFRLGPVIFKVIVNLVAKAITAPFSLLAGILSGGEELNVVSFAPGSAVLDAAAKAQLDKVAQTLKERPALRMTVVGTAELGSEREAFKRERLQAMLLAEKQRAAALAGKSRRDVAPVSAQEAPVLLREVYKRAEMPKPRNLLGLVKSLPPAEMEALLLAHIVVTEDSMRELAAARGAAVKDYLAVRELPVAQLFLGAPKLAPTETKVGARAELTLSAK
jgi:hypothetical protein